MTQTTAVPIGWWIKMTRINGDIFWVRVVNQ